jgi:hypothetical protein
MPVTAEGKHYLRRDFVRLGARGRDPLRARELGTLRTAISVEMMITGNINTARANAPAIAEKPTLRSCTMKEKANSPIKIEGAPAMVWEITRSVVANLD